MRRRLLFGLISVAAMAVLLVIDPAIKRFATDFYGWQSELPQSIRYFAGHIVVLLAGFVVGAALAPLLTRGAVRRCVASYICPGLIFLILLVLEQPGSQTSDPYWTSFLLMLGYVAFAPVAMLVIFSYSPGLFPVWIIGSCVSCYCGWRLEKSDRAAEGEPSLWDAGPDGWQGGTLGRNYVDPASAPGSEGENPLVKGVVARQQEAPGATAPAQSLK